MRGAFEAILESFRTRVIKQIPSELLAAACLDPQQVHASFTIKFLEICSTNVQMLLKALVQKYNLNEIAVQMQQGINDSVYEVFFF